MSTYHQTEIVKLFDVERIVTVWYRRLPRGYRSVGEKHDFWEILYVDRGEFTVTVDDVDHHLSPGQMILYAPNAFHTTRGKPLEGAIGAGIVSFVCRSEAMEVFGNQVLRPDADGRRLLRDILKRGEESFEEIHGGQVRGITLKPDAPVQNTQVIRNLLELLLISLWEARGLRDDPLKGNNQNNLENSLALKIEAYLQENQEEKISLEGIGTKFGISVSTVKQVFKKQFGHGVIAHRNELRIREAQRLICESDLNFTQIADRLGFESVHYFSRLFRSVTGMSPTEYSKSIVYGE